MTYLFTASDRHCYVSTAWHRYRDLCNLALDCGWVAPYDRLAILANVWADPDDQDSFDRVKDMADDALDWLNKHTDPSLIWEWANGDLILTDRVKASV